MKPFCDYDLRKVIDNQWIKVRSKVDGMSNEEILANDIDVLSENIFQEFYIEPVTIYEEDFSKRRIEQGKIRKHIDPFFRGYADREYVEVDGVIASFYFPYEGDQSLFKCRASTFSVSGYPDIVVDNETISFHVERSLSELDKPESKNQLLKMLDKNLEDIRKGISYANSDVNAFNNSLKRQSEIMIQEKRKKVNAYYNISKMFEVPIEKKEYAQTHIPLKRNIVPISKHYERSNYYGITDYDYNDILSAIKHTCSTYERTPSSYQFLHEEDLRNTLLATLNATYKGDATGETFRNKGKTDICIERENRAAFVAECKMWTGQKDVEKAIEQLDGYLTWRDCKTALIYFVRRKDFIRILDLMESTLGSIENMRNVSAVDKNEFECLFLSKENPGQQIKLRVMLFNLFYEKTSSV